MSGSPALVLGVDGGNSKTDLALADTHGRLAAVLRGPSVSHQAVGLEQGMATLAGLADRLSGEARRGSRRPRVKLAVLSLAGADFPGDVRLLDDAIGRLHLAERHVILNDTFGALRAGTDRSWGVVLICGQGMNAAGIAPDGRVARFPGVGDISGDWGGGVGVAMAGLGAAVRGRDGRGPRTSLERLVPAHFGMSRPYALVEALYTGRLAQSRIAELAPVVFAAAADGDAVARGIVNRLADELVDWARAVIRRLALGRRDPEIVLAGGVFRTEEAGFYARLREGIGRVAPHARIVRLAAPPVLGAVLIGLDRLAGGSTPPDVAARLRTAFARWAPAAAAGR